MFVIAVYRCSISYCVEVASQLDAAMLYVYTYVYTYNYIYYV